MLQDQYPVVAICIPSYEKVMSFKRLIFSIQEQTYKNYIICVTDDSISSNVMDFCRLYESDNFFYKKNKNRLGPTNNSNECIKLALLHNADYIKIMHCDDYFSKKNSLELIVTASLTSNKNIVFVGNNESYVNRTIPRYIQYSDLCKLNKDLSYIFRKNFLGAPSNLFISRKVAQSATFDSNLTWLFDVDYYLQILSQNDFLYCDKKLVNIGHSEEQLTDYCLSRPSIVVRENFYLYKKYHCIKGIKNLLFLMFVTFFAFVNFIKFYIKKYFF